MVDQEALVSEKRESTSAIHDALDNFDFVDGSFNKTVAVICRDGVYHGVEVWQEQDWERNGIYSHTTPKQALLSGSFPHDCVAFQSA